MMMTTSKRSLDKRKVRLLLDRDLRNKYVADQIKIGLRNQLRSLREDRGITQAEMAQLIGTKQSVISRIERDPVRVGLPVFIDIAEKLDVAFVARFEAIDTVVEWYDNPSVKKMTPRKSETILKERALDLMTETVNYSNWSMFNNAISSRMPVELFAPKDVPVKFQPDFYYSAGTAIAVKPPVDMLDDVIDLGNVDMHKGLYDPISGLHYGVSFEKQNFYLP